MKRADIDLLLPEIFRRTLPPVRTGANPLEAFLDVMELLHAPDEDVLASLETYFDPYRAPDLFVAYLAGWVDLDRLWIENPQEFTAKTLPPFPSGVGRLRELVAAAAFLSRWRGTARGLLHFLETATGISGFKIDERVLDEDGQPIPFHIRVTAPKAAEVYRVLIDSIIMKEKPAYVTYELEIDAQ
ncbi:MAG: phage tail protein [Anaerolineae bacterium]